MLTHIAAAYVRPMGGMVPMAVHAHSSKMPTLNLPSSKGRTSPACSEYCLRLCECVCSVKPGVGWESHNKH